MPRFLYTATNAEGWPVQGSLDAANEDAAIAALREMELGVASLRQEQAAPSWKDMQQEQASLVQASQWHADKTAAGYVPLVETLRLYAGWLLAWYFLVLVIGSYQAAQRLPWKVPFVEGLFQSSSILNFSCAVFLFLLLSTVHAWMGKGTVKGIILIIVGFCLFVLFSANI